MGVSANIEVYGLKAALKELNKVNPTLRRQMTKEFKAITKPVVERARALNPTDAPLSGMERNWTTSSGYQMFPWNPSLSDKAIKSGTSGKKPKEFNGIMQNASVFFIKWTAAQNTLLEMSGKGKTPTPQGARMARALSNRFGQPGRVLWRAYGEQADEVEREVLNIVEFVMKQVERKVVTG